MASGKQGVSRVSQSNPELAMRRITILDELDQETQPENSKPDQPRIPAAGDGLPQTKEGSCYPVLYESPLHKPQSSTGASPLPFSSVSTVVEGHGRVPPGWQHSLH